MKRKRQATIYRGTGVNETKGWYVLFQYEDQGAWYDEATDGPFTTRKRAAAHAFPGRPRAIPPEHAGAFTLPLD